MMQIALRELLEQVEELLDLVDPPDRLYVEGPENGLTPDEVVGWATWALECVNTHIESGYPIPRQKGDPIPEAGR